MGMISGGCSVQIAVGRNHKRCRPGLAVRNHIKRWISKRARIDAVLWHNHIVIVQIALRKRIYAGSRDR
jgi:hypothetical protein